MRKNADVLTCLALDEIPFRMTHEEVIMSREEFERLCKKMKGVGGATLPMLQGLHSEFESVWSYLRLSTEDRSRWFESFYSVRNIVRFSSVYEVKERLKKKIFELRQFSTSGIPSPF